MYISWVPISTGSYNKSSNLGVHSMNVYTYVRMYIITYVPTLQFCAVHTYMYVRISYIHIVVKNCGIVQYTLQIFVRSTHCIFVQCIFIAVFHNFVQYTLYVRTQFCILHTYCNNSIKNCSNSIITRIKCYLFALYCIKIAQVFVSDSKVNAKHITRR